MWPDLSLTCDRFVDGIQSEQLKSVHVVPIADFCVIWNHLMKNGIAMESVNLLNLDRKFVMQHLVPRDIVWRISCSL